MPDDIANQANRSGGDRDAARGLDRARDARIVADALGGDPGAFGKLYDLWFDRVFDLASRIVRDPDIAADVAQDAFLSAWRSLGSLQDRDAFGGWLLRIARNAALTRSAKEQRSRAIDDQELAVIEAVGAGASNAPDGFRVEDRLARSQVPDAAVEDAEVRSLVWEAATALGDRDVEVLDLQLRHGLSPAEIGEVLGMNRNAANQLVHRLRGRLETAIRARVLWRGGDPACDVLARRLASAGVATFDADAVRVIERHVPGCASCDERQRLRLQPAALFGALPIIAAPIFFKTQAAAALELAGVPMQGSSFAGAAAAPATSAGAATESGASLTEPASIGSALPGVEDPRATPGGHDAEVVARRGARAARAALLTAAAIVIVVGTVVAFGGRVQDAGVDLAVQGTTTVTAPTTTAATPGTGSAPVATSSPPTSVVTTPTTVATTTRVPGTTSTSTSTSTTTSTTAPPGIVFRVDPAAIATTSWPWSPTALPPATPTLVWDVPMDAYPDGTWVLVNGPENGADPGFRATAPAGTRPLCPAKTGAPTCTVAAPNGSIVFTYRLVVTGPDGTQLDARSATLTVG